MFENVYKLTSEFLFGKPLPIGKATENFKPSLSNPTNYNGLPGSSFFLLTAFYMS
mgnify:CR=1 FL=1